MIDMLSLLVGLFVGWASMWALDYWFFGQRMRSDATELRTLRERQATKEADREDALARLVYAEGQLEEMGIELVTRRADAKEAMARADRLQDELTATQNNLTVTKNELDDLRMQLKVANIRAGSIANDEEFELQQSESITVSAPSIDEFPQKENLRLINGIGPVYEQRLNSAGIINFAQLHRQDPKRVHAIINPKNWQQIDPEAWVAEAGLFAAQPELQGDVLIQVKGVGPQYAQLLRSGGIDSLEVLADCSVEQIEQLLGDELLATVDLNEWIAHAQKLIS